MEGQKSSVFTSVPVMSSTHLMTMRTLSTLSNTHILLLLHNNRLSHTCASVKIAPLGVFGKAHRVGEMTRTIMDLEEELAKIWGLVGELSGMSHLDRV